ncbi:ribonuclease H family protein [Cellulophaga sp. F20128]|uniref:ribonuclease H1 domain-containing protein n=1 Tax=Cellulophaga sp. F20128 TaxID=2926413 RepID=UPI001FF45E24|nr:ribonuclease H family protein [Cellulophaga sp. F20128]MCK0158576.1 ribonuclease H family protein [Cellulophaga sp. F20128]
MAKKGKFYTVWRGKKPGIYDSWSACKAAISGEKGAQYKSFLSFEAAKKAFNGSYDDYKGKKLTSTLSAQELQRIGKPNYNSIAVDAASSGNPGVMEYRGVDTQSGKELFRQGPFRQGTNNIGEFLALVHGLAYLKKNDSERILYTDSRTAMSWIRKKKCNSKLKESEKNKDVFELIDRAVDWLNTNTYKTTVVKWETKAWGEIPADFGRK